jgi:hypothetical protein
MRSNRCGEELAASRCRDGRRSVVVPKWTAIVRANRGQPDGLLCRASRKHPPRAPPFRRFCERVGANALDLAIRRSTMVERWISPPQPGTVSNVLGRSVRYVVGLDMPLANVGSAGCLILSPVSRKGGDERPRPSTASNDFLDGPVTYRRAPATC